MKIGILECGHAPDEVQRDHGDFADMFQRIFADQGFSYQRWDVEAMDFPDSPAQADGWLLTGSKHGAYEDHPFIAPLEAFIRTCQAENRPMIGICFGHQIIAQALGGRVEKYHGGWAVGRHEYEFAGLGPAAVNAWHQDQVTRPPDGARTLASSAFCAHAALAYGDSILTVQPHPEITNPVVGSYIAARRGTGSYPEDLMDRAEAQKDMPNDEARVAAMLATFLKTRALPA